MASTPTPRHDLRRYIAPGVGAVLGSLASMSVLAANDSPVVASAKQLQVGKAEQRWLGIRTQTAASARTSLILPGRVIVDPRQHQRIAAGEAGLIEAPEGGFLLAGSAVGRGDVLAWLRPAIAEPARRDLQAQLAIAERDVAMGNMQIKRFSIDESQAIDGHLVTPSIRIVMDYRAAKARVAHLEHSLSARTAIRASASGTLLRSSAEAGSLTPSGVTLFEIDGSAQAVIEAPIAADHRTTAETAVAILNDGAQALLNLGTRFNPASRSWFARYATAATPGSAALLPGQSVRVTLAALPDAPITLPAASLFEHEQQQWVWIHTAPEVFVAQAVRVARHDAENTLIQTELQPDQRIVVTGGDALTRRLQTQQEPPT